LRTAAERTGSKTIIHVHGGSLYCCGNHSHTGTPASIAASVICTRTSAGNKLLFEEINHDLQLTYRYAWRTGDRFGFIKSSWLENLGETECRINLVDGLQNILPIWGTTTVADYLSNLLNGYKRNELDRDHRPGHLRAERHPDRPCRTERVAHGHCGMADGP
jgi:hypothetical protein